MKKFWILPITALMISCGAATEGTTVAEPTQQNVETTEEEDAATDGADATTDGADAATDGADAKAEDHEGHEGH